MTRQIHDRELDTDEAVVRALLSSQCPQWSGRPVEYVAASGTDNAMWRVRVRGDSDVVVRLPRRPEPREAILAESQLLNRLAETTLVSTVAVPEVLHLGEPDEAFPQYWAVYRWIDGSDVWTSRNSRAWEADQLADDLGAVVLALRELESNLPVPRRSAGQRGGPIGPLVRRLEWWLDEPDWRASELLDVARARAIAVDALSVEDNPGGCFLHGDLIPGNLLVRSGRLEALLDWGGAGYGDPAQDLSPAWSVFDSPARERFRAIVRADDATWTRARTIALEQAVAGVVYYVPRGHPLGEVMAQTLDRILSDA